MGTKEELIEELGFLDCSSFAMDENPNGKREDKNVLNKEVPAIPINQSLLSMIDGLGDDAALAVLEAYKKIPKKVKEATRIVYEGLQRLGGEASMEDIKNSLKRLREACGDEYKDVYDEVLKDAKKLVPKIQMRLMVESLE